MSKNNLNTNSAKDLNNADSTINEHDNVMITAVNDADESYIQKVRNDEETK